MIGGMLAGHDESQKNRGRWQRRILWNESHPAREVHGKRKDGYRGNEGRFIPTARLVTVENTIEDILAG